MLAEWNGRMWTSSPERLLEIAEQDRFLQPPAWSLTLFVFEKQGSAIQQNQQQQLAPEVVERPKHGVTEEDRLLPHATPRAALRKPQEEHIPYREVIAVLKGRKAKEAAADRQRPTTRRRRGQKSSPSQKTEFSSEWGSQERRTERQRYRRR